MPSTDVIREIAEFNQGRDPRRLRMKYEAMRKSAFAFLRGSCHLFYAGLPADEVLRDAPAAWISGDLHLENFGAYKGDNRLVYFDLNDFDEACLAPCTWEPLRMLASIILAGDLLGADEKNALKLCRIFLDAYRAELAAGKPRWIERPLSKGLIKDLLQDLKRTEREKFLDRRTFLKGKHRKFRIDDRHALETTDDEREQVAAALGSFAKGQERGDFYQVVDVADRIAGTGSLGVKRYSVLVEGRGSPDGNFLLDVKEALPSAPSSHLKAEQPEWESEAERVVSLQRTLEAISPALLSPLEIGGRPFVLKELQPVEQRIDLEEHQGRLGKLGGLMRSLGELTAWSTVRGAGWRSSAPREALMAFGDDAGWAKGLLELARERSKLIDGYWEEYSAAFDAGRFG